MLVFVTGGKGVGKSTLVNHCLAGWKGDVQGFRSFKQATGTRTAAIYFTPIGQPAARHILGRVHNGEKQFFPEILESTGVQTLSEITSARHCLVVLDEIGHIESNAPRFQREIERVLRLGLPVLAVLRQEDTPFLHKLFTWQGAHILTLTPHNRESCTAQCLHLLGLAEK